MMGFAPGFPYLDGLDERLHLSARLRRVIESSRGPLPLVAAMRESIRWPVLEGGTCWDALIFRYFNLKRRVAP